MVSKPIAFIGALTAIYAVVNGFTHKSSKQPMVTFIPPPKVDMSFKPLPMHQYQPGDTWTYSIHSSRGAETAILSVLDQKMHAPDGKECMLLQVQAVGPDGKKSVSLGAFRQDSSGAELIYGRLGPNDKTFQWGLTPHPYSIRIQKELRPGTCWMSSIYLPGHSAQIFRATVDKPAIVTAKAGKFNTLLIHENTLYAQKGEIVRTHGDDSWLAPSIGFPVKVVSKDPNHATVQELTSYHLAAAIPRV